MFQLKNNALILDGKTVDINGIKIEKEFARGANGVIFLAVDSLQRKVIFKIWDRQYVSGQGLDEAMKCLKAYASLSEYTDESLDNPYFIKDKTDIIDYANGIIGNIYYSGSVQGYFYVVMEFIDGITLNRLLKQKDVPLGLKANIALKLNQINYLLLKNEIDHGDLHGDNILIVNFKKIKYPTTRHIYKLKIIDFGTSIGLQHMNLIKNHELLINTINNCIKPFNLHAINASDIPQKTDQKSNYSWIQAQLFALRAGFFELGNEFVGWPLYRSFGMQMLTTKGFSIDTSTVKKQIIEYEKKGRIQMNIDFLGISEDWDTFDGRTAIRGD